MLYNKKATNKLSIVRRIRSMNINKQTRPSVSTATEKALGYSEIIEHLDSRWQTSFIDASKNTMKQLDKAFGNPSAKITTILVGGSNGKSLTINYATQLLKEEGLSVCSMYAPHLLTYNERIAVNNESISNKVFADLANEVLATASKLGLNPHALDILSMIALLHSVNSKTDVLIAELALDGNIDPITICKPLIIGITRITDIQEESDEMKNNVKNILAAIQKDSWVVSADQSKFNLIAMEQEAKTLGARWAMPIRKLSKLSYPFEQLHGRCAALAERICQLFMEDYVTSHTIIATESLLMRPSGPRGRPTLDAKRQSELNPKRTLDHFWKETLSTLPGRFELLDKEKPSILLDNADTLDAFENLLLGIRLLHYQRPLKGLTIVIGSENGTLQTAEFIKTLRYFFKKTAGQVIFCPLKKSPLACDTTNGLWNPEEMTNLTKAAKIKSRCAKNFAEAYELAAQGVDERQGLVVVAGSRSILNEYWTLKGIKKIN
jgi:dihydrofolate synthase/folylpolyglutamate synthase